MKQVKEIRSESAETPKKVSRSRIAVNLHHIPLYTLLTNHSIKVKLAKKATKTLIYEATRTFKLSKRAEIKKVGLEIDFNIKA